MFDSGYMDAGSWRGIPVRIHWSALLGAFAFGGLRFAPGAWLAFFLLVVLHELGHAWLAHRRRLRVVGVSVLAFGGECRYAGNITPFDQAVVAWGGVLAQAVVLALALGAGFLWPGPHVAFVAQLLHALIFANALLIGLNLLPFQPLDGYWAWRLPRMLRFGKSTRTKRRKPGGGSGSPPRSGNNGKSTGRATRRTPEPVDPEQARDHADHVTKQALENARKSGAPSRPDDPDPSEDDR